MTMGEQPAAAAANSSDVGGSSDFSVAVSVQRKAAMSPAFGLSMGGLAWWRCGGGIWIGDPMGNPGLIEARAEVFEAGGIEGELGYREIFKRFRCEIRPRCADARIRWPD